MWVPVVHRRTERGRLLVPLGKRGRIVRADLSAFRLQWRKIRVVIDLSADRMVVRDGRRKLGSFPVGKGSPSMPTPTGRFFVTDRLRFGQGSPYAPFAVGLSAHVSQLPASWLGGDQVAIHFGALGAVSHGCIHAQLDAIRMLERRAALGSLVIIQRVVRSARRSPPRPSSRPSSRSSRSRRSWRLTTPPRRSSSASRAWSPGSATSSAGGRA